MNRRIESPAEPDVRTLEPGPTGRRAHRAGLEMKEVIGSGKRGVVRAVHVLLLNEDGSPIGLIEDGLVHKQFADLDDDELNPYTGEENQRSALEGYEIANQAGLPVPRTFRKDGRQGILITDLRKNGRLVLSPANSWTADYSGLERDKIDTIEGLDEFTNRFISEVFNAGKVHEFSLTADAIFLLLKRIGHETSRSFSIDYILGDFENLPRMVGRSTPKRNVVIALATLRMFIRDCVSVPEPYVERVQRITKQIAGVS